MVICEKTPPKEKLEAEIFTNIIAFLTEKLKSIMNWFSTIQNIIKIIIVLN